MLQTHADSYFFHDNTVSRKSIIFADCLMEYPYEYSVLKSSPESTDMDPIAHHLHVLETLILILHVESNNL